MVKLVFDLTFLARRCAMQLSLINPYIRLATPSVLPEGHRIARRVIYDYELIYLERGAWTFVYGGVPYLCHAGDVLFIHPGIPHSFDLDRGEVSQPHIHFDVTARPDGDKIPVSFKDLDAMTEGERRQIHKDYFSAYPHTPFLTIGNKAAFFEIFYRIVSGACSPIEAKGLMTVLLSMIVKDNFPDLMEKQEPSSVVDRIKDYIDAGNGFSMSLDDFAQFFHYDKFHLERQFKAAFGTSLIRYRNEMRMEYARRLLATKSVTATAEELGFESIYSFSRAYKNRYGFPPPTDR